MVVLSISQNLRSASSNFSIFIARSGTEQTLSDLIEDICYSALNTIATNLLTKMSQEQKMGFGLPWGKKADGSFEVSDDALERFIGTLEVGCYTFQRVASNFFKVKVSEDKTQLICHYHVEVRYVLMEILRLKMSDAPLWIEIGQAKRDEGWLWFNESKTSRVFRVQGPVPGDLV
jgi:hypothetical protein